MHARATDWHALCEYVGRGILLYRVSPLPSCVCVPLMQTHARAPDWYHPACVCVPVLYFTADCVPPYAQPPSPPGLSAITILKSYSEPFILCSFVMIQQYHTAEKVGGGGYSSITIHWKMQHTHSFFISSSQGAI